MMKVEAKNRSQRLRKKLKVDEYQELGFDIAWSFPDKSTDKYVDGFIDSFFDEIIKPSGLSFAGEGDMLWHGLVCTQQNGSCTEEHRDLVKKWLTANQAKTVSVGALYDFWWS